MTKFIFDRTYPSQAAELITDANLKEMDLIHAITDAIQHFSNRQLAADRDRMDELFRYIIDQREFSSRTFGPGMRTKGICDHIRKELREIEENPTDLMEWIDVIILAFDGYWRAGGSAYEAMLMIREKLEVNKARNWPAPGPEDVAIEHVREGK